MSRIDWLDRELRNWARWMLGQRAGGLGYARCDMSVERVDGGEGYDAQAHIPVDACEAEVIDRAVMALDGVLRATVEQVYLQPGTMTDHAAKLGCHERTLRDRIERAHNRIAAWMSDRKAAAEAERSRVHALQRQHNLA
jgi:DNA-directed RNA polymerase specialized sigma24 family protein